MRAVLKLECSLYRDMFTLEKTSVKMWIFRIINEYNVQLFYYFLYFFRFKSVLGKSISAS